MEQIPALAHIFSCMKHLGIKQYLLLAMVTKGRTEENKRVYKAVYLSKEDIKSPATHSVRGASPYVLLLTFPYPAKPIKSHRRVTLRKS